MTTPGAIKRFITGAWTRDGSYMLYVPTLGAAPAAPDDNGVFVFVLDEERLYYSMGGSWVRYGVGPKVVANAAALPTGTFAGEARTTADTGTLWIWTGSYWRPQVAPTNQGVNFAGGTVPTSGSLALGTITIAAAPYPRLVTASGMAFLGSTATTATQFQIYGTHLSGFQWFTRGFVNTSIGVTFVLPPITQTLAANTGGTVSYTASYVGGTSATTTVTANGSFSRGDVFIQPV